MSANSKSPKMAVRKNDDVPEKNPARLANGVESWRASNAAEYTGR